MKREREEEKEDEYSRGREYQWVFVGMDASTGKMESIPYKDVVEDGEAFDSNEVRHLANHRVIYKFKYRYIGDTPSVVNPTKGAVTSDGGKKQQRILPQQMVPQIETYDGYIFHSRWIDRGDYEMYAFVKRPFNTIGPLERGYTIPDITCGRQFGFMYGIQWAIPYE